LVCIYIFYVLGKTHKPKGRGDGGDGCSRSGGTGVIAGKLVHLPH